jgi:hypothetical protein
MNILDESVVSQHGLVIGAYARVCRHTSFRMAATRNFAVLEHSQACAPTS